MINISNLEFTFCNWISNICFNYYTDHEAYWEDPYTQEGSSINVQWAYTDFEKVFGDSIPDGVDRITSEVVDILDDCDFYTWKAISNGFELEDHPALKENFDEIVGLVPVEMRAE